MNPSASSCTMEVVGKTVAVAQTTIVVPAVVQTVVETVPYAVATLFNGLLPLCSRCPLFCPG